MFFCIANRETTFCLLLLFSLYCIDCSAGLLDELGGALKNMCKYDEAIERYEQSASLYSRLAGGGVESSLDYARVLMNLANVLNDSRHYETALAYYNESLRIKQRLLPGGEQNEHCAQVLLNMAQVLDSLNRHDEAAQRVEQAVRIKERVYGANHVELSGALVARMYRPQTLLSDALTARTNVSLSVALYRLFYSRQYGVD